MATIRSYTTVEQSKKLAEILPLESADSHYVRHTHDYMGNPIDGKWSHPKYGNPNSKYAHYVVQNFSNYDTIPCWSLSALLDVIPQEIFDGEYIINITEGRNNKWLLTYDDYENENYSYYGLSLGADTLVDACVEMILKLHERKLL